MVISSGALTVAHGGTSVESLVGKRITVRMSSYKALDPKRTDVSITGVLRAVADHHYGFARKGKVLVIETSAEWRTVSLSAVIDMKVWN